ncbi:hypothetical protein E3U43_007404 [Larimichthys crocea]|uniref:Uncharacterized protein n=1 Tax=Larimichthys crocea TaxID=215358 RepID=A0ACD3Q5J3_LARCR|nr:hypothetical protein E3U43_007404 [Larimichthys crocea]
MAACGDLLTKRTEDLPRRQRLRAGLGFGKRGWISSKPPEIPAAVEQDGLKELYKKTLKHDKTQTHSYMSHRYRVQRSCRHTTCTPTANATYTQLHWLSSGTTSAYTPGLHQITQIQTHTSISAHQYKR